jgi:hypothetical protein
MSIWGQKKRLIAEVNCSKFYEKTKSKFIMRGCGM